MRVSLWLRGVVAVLVGLVVAVMTAWAAGAIYYSDLPGARLRAALAIGFVVATALAFLLLPRRRRTLAGFLVVFALLVVWWLRIPASNDRDWQPEVSVTPWASIDGDRVTIHGVRNLGYRTETDFVPSWEDRTYDLRKAGLRRSDRRLLGGQADRPHHGELRLRGQGLPRHLDRDAQGAGRELLHDRRLLQAVRAGVHRGRRAGPDPGAHELPAAPGGRLHLPDADAARQYPPGLPRLHQDDERAARAAQLSTTRSPPTARRPPSSIPA